MRTSRIWQNEYLAYSQMLDDEAKTKQFLILPLIRALGYDDANPAEVVPEYTADFGTRTGWKADYALMSGERPLIVMECKQLSNRLSTDEINQLGRYFSFVPFAGAKIGILTNGVIYKFFTDETEPNKMDEEPFWQVNLESLTDNDLTQFKNFTKDDFGPPWGRPDSVSLQIHQWNERDPEPTISSAA